MSKRSAPTAVADAPEAKRPAPDPETDSESEDELSEPTAPNLYLTPEMTAADIPHTVVHNLKVDPQCTTLDALAGITRYTGLIQLEDTAVTNTAGFANVTRFTEMRVGSNPALTHIQMPLLSRMGECVIHANAALVSILLPLLFSVDQDIAITENDALTKLDLSSLNAVHANVYVWSCFLLREIRLPKLETVLGAIGIETNSNLVVFTAPNLCLADTVTVKRNNALLHLALPRLASVNETMEVLYNRALISVQCPFLVAAQQIVLVGNACLTHLRFDLLRLVHERIQVSENAALIHAAFPSLATAQIVSFSGNRSLVHLSLAQLAMISGMFSLSWNSALADVNLERLVFVNMFLYMHNGMKRLQLPSLVLLNSELDLEDEKLESIDTPALAMVNGVVGHLKDYGATLIAKHRSG